MLSKATAQGSVTCVRNTITKTALPTTSSVGTNPTSNPLFFLWQKAWNRRRSISWASAKDSPRSSPRLYAPRTRGRNPESSAPSPAGALRHARQRTTANVCKSDTSSQLQSGQLPLEVVRHPTAASSPACLCVRTRRFRARMLLGCRPKVRFALVFVLAAPLRWRAAVALVDAGSPINRFPSDQNCTVRPLTEWSILYRLPRALA
jgi:hypothetical protein